MGAELVRATGLTRISRRVLGNAALASARHCHGFYEASSTERLPPSAP